VGAAESQLRTAQTRLAEWALAPVAQLQDTVRDARRTRDAVAQGWESALAALKRGARAAADEGAPDLYPTLFPPVIRAVMKSKTPEEQAPPVRATPAAA
jgi:hypothetical protein